MKRNLFFLIAFCALTAHSALAQRKLNERRAIVPNGFVRIFIANGSVTVIGWDKDSLVVNGTVHETPNDRFAIGVTPKGAKLGMWSDVEAGQTPSNIIVYVPARSQVWVKTTGADIRVSSVSGGLDLFSVSGSIEVTNAPHEIYAETMGGNIVLNALTETARLKTASGGLRVGGYVADLTAVTVSGAIDLVKLRFKRGRVASVDGDIRYEGGIPGGSVLEVTNHSGAVDLFLQNTANTDFAVSLYQGKVMDEIGALKKKALKPDARVTIRSFKGRVTLRKA